MSAIAFARSLILSRPDPIAAFAALYDVLFEEDRFRAVHPFFVTQPRSSISVKPGEAIWRGLYLADVIVGDQILFPSSLARVMVFFLDDLASTPDRNDPVFIQAVTSIVYATRLIDTCLNGLGHRRPSSVVETLQPYLDRLAHYNNLLLPGTGDGLVLPAGRVCNNGNSLPQFYANLARVPGYIACRIDYSRTASIGRLTKTTPLRIGIVALVLDQDEVVWEPRGGRASVSLTSTMLSTVVTRMITTLDWIVDKGADIVVMPELVSHVELRSAIKRWARVTPNAPGLLVAGTEAVDVSTAFPVNRAFVLDNYGEERWSQDKVHTYTFPRELLSKSGLNHVLGEGPLAEESVNTMASAMIVRDIPNVGRCMVLICEDFAREDPGRQIAREVGADLVLVPVMDQAPQPSGWWERMAFDIAQDPEARTALANSYAVMARIPVGPDSPHHIGVVVSPERCKLVDQLLDPKSGRFAAVIYA
jgi:predicted amidohydrolase